jgi:type I restriction enzyme S subunit
VKAGWQTTPFEDCIEQVTYTTKIQRKDFLSEGTFPIVSQEEDLINGRWENEADLFKVERPLVLFGDHTRSFKYVDFDFVLGADGVKILKPKTFLHPRYFYFQLQTAKLESLGYARHFRLLKEHSVSYPDFAEQHRIVTLLDEAFADIATAKANAKKNLQNAEVLFQSQLQALFNRPSGGRVQTTLGKATGGIFTGPFGSLLHKHDYVENGIPLVNPAHISPFGIEPDYRKTVSNETASRLANYIMRAGDIVIGRRGEMGRCALITDMEDGWLCGTGSFFIKPSNRCDAAYLVHLLRSEGCKQQLEKIAGGAVMPNLSNTDLSNFVVELPSIDEQKRIVSQIELAGQDVEQLKSIYRQKLTALDDLKKSLLHQAFSGQL